jgi:hypothetical protein
MFNKKYRNAAVRNERREDMKCFFMISFLLLQAKEVVTVSKRQAPLRYGVIRYNVNSVMRGRCTVEVSQVPTSNHVILFTELNSLLSHSVVTSLLGVIQCLPASPVSIPSNEKVGDLNS